MENNRVTLVTCAQYPHLEEDEAGLLDALRDNQLDPQVACWDDPKVDWEKAGVCIVRSVRNYPQHRAAFLHWARRVPRLLNPADVMEWATDKHYLKEMEQRGLPVIPTTWLEVEDDLTKHQVHTRFPALGEFVVKPSVSSGARGTGRYTGRDGNSRMRAINHAFRLLQEGEAVMVQRYLPQVDIHGETSLIFMNGVLSHVVDKKGMLTPVAEELQQSGEDTAEQVQGPVEAKERVIQTRSATAEEWQWGEAVRRIVHRYVKDRIGHDLQFLFMRIDLVRDGQGGFYVMEISPVDANLYLSGVEGGVQSFADAIASRVLW